MTATQSKARIITKRWSSPCGELELASLGEELVMCDWVNGWHRQAGLRRTARLLKAEFAPGDSPIINRALEELGEYFAGRRRTFDIRVRLVGSDFQVALWKALSDIPYGQLVTYGTLARRLGKPSATRAVANAVGANPFSIIIPCHRVIGADGSLTGYGGGYSAKRKLLALETGLSEASLPWPNGPEPSNKTHR